VVTTPLVTMSRVHRRIRKKGKKTLGTHSWFDRKNRIAPSTRSPISSVDAQDDRANHSLFRYAGGPYQLAESRRIAESVADVVGLVAGVELHARPRKDGQTSDNLIRTRECVINLPSEDLVTHVDRLALTTGKDPVPEKKRQWGYRHEPDKFAIAGFTPMESVSVGPPRVHECPVQMEGIVHDFRPFGKNVSANMFEVHIVKLHVDEKLLISQGPRPYIDPVRWRPLVMSSAGSSDYPVKYTRHGWRNRIS
jgi:flavin reductase (DIM6/NTAB) family NADH-FMN oxidoreductase RutF